MVLSTNKVGIRKTHLKMLCFDLFVLVFNPKSLRQSDLSETPTGKFSKMTKVYRPIQYNFAADFLILIFLLILPVFGKDVCDSL